MTIAGSDSGGAAGIQADLRTFAALGVHGTSALTAITAQSSVEVREVVILEPAMVVAQIDTVLDDMPVRGFKTGMLATAEIIRAVAGRLQARRCQNVVVDPVMVTRHGERLLAPEAEAAYVSHLFPLATVITPNLFEAAALLGVDRRALDEESAIHDAARALVTRGARAVVITGGGFEGDALDVFADERGTQELRYPRVDTRHTSGSGCSFSAAIAARLARGDELQPALLHAKDYVSRAVATAYATGRGHGALGHLYAHPAWRGAPATIVDDAEAH